MSADPQGPPRVHVVEPTLEDYAGHCYGLVRSFCDAAVRRPITIWGGKDSARLEFDPAIDVRPVFRRRLRLVQLYWLFRRLLRGSDPVVVMTARRADLALAHWAAGGVLAPDKLSVYFHWYRETPKRLAFLRKAARVQPNVTILATTESVADIFRRAGFKRVVLLPYPLTARAAGKGGGGTPFRHLLYAGAARQDKGFGKVVDLVERLQQRGERWPVTIQLSADHYGKYDQKTKLDIERLRRCSYSGLTLLPETLLPEQYAELYRGAICLQPYDREAFRDRASGVTMDALTQGSPVIVPSDTWMAALVEPESAGLVLRDFGPEALLTAVQTILNDYDRFSRNARSAGASLRERSWAPLLSLLPRH